MSGKRRISVTIRIAYEHIRDLYLFWQSCCKDGKYPRQSDIDLSKIPDLISNTYILDVLEDQKFSYRFIGTNIDRHLGVSITGKRVDEYRSGAALKTLTDFCSHVAETGDFGYLITKMSSENTEHLVYQRSALPISDDGIVINKLIGGWYYHAVEENPSRMKRVETPDYEQVALMSVIYEDTSPHRLHVVP